MKLDEAKALQVNDIVVHNFLKSEWVVIDKKLYKTNPARVDIFLQLRGQYGKAKFTEKQLQLYRRLED